MNLHDLSCEVAHTGLVLSHLTLVHILPDAGALGLPDQLRLLELAIVIGIEVGVLRRAQLSVTFLEELGSDITLREVKSTNQITIHFIDALQLDSNSAVQEHLVDECFSFLKDMWLGISGQVQVNHVHFDLSLQAHHVNNDLCWAEHMLQNRTQRSGLLS